MNNEVYEEQRPHLRVEDPPDWWIEKMKRNSELDENEETESGVIIVDIGSGESPSEKDSNGVIIIQM